MAEESAATIAGRALRSIPSALRDAAQERNLKLGPITRTARALPCACRVARTDGTHESACPVYQRQKSREYKARVKQAKAG